MVGLLQMFGAVVSLTLLAAPGVTAIALGAVAMTSLVTTISVVLSGGRHPKQVPHRSAPVVSDDACGRILPRVRVCQAWHTHALRRIVPAIAVVLACCSGRNDPTIAVAVERTDGRRVSARNAGW